MGRIGNPYQRILGDGFAALHPHVRRAHCAPLTAIGALEVEHGVHWATPLLVRWLRLPARGTQPVRLDVAMTGDELTWSRRIGSTPLETRQRAEGPLLVERHGIGCIAFHLEARDGALSYTQQGFFIAGVRIPRPVSPSVSASVAATGDGWCVDVTVTWRARLVCHYAGEVHPV